MKYVKMLGLAAVAAAALMAFVGASTASATVLCKTTGTGSPTGTTCPANQAYPAGTEIHAVNEGNAVLTGPETTVLITCTISTVKGSTENEGSNTETVKGPIEKLTFENCGAGVTVTVLKPGKLEVHWIEGTHDGTLTSSGAEVTTVTPSIFGNVHCIYTTTNSDIGKLTHSSTDTNAATMEAEHAPLQQLSTSGLCPSQAFWDAKYEVTTPKPLFVAGHT